MTENVVEIGKAVRGAKVAPQFGGGGGDDPTPGLPPGAPITCLGKQGLTLWMLDHANQLLSLKPRELGKGELLALCGEEEWLIRQWPQLTQQEWTIVHNEKVEPHTIAKKFDQARAQQAIVLACSIRGVFNPTGRLFGRGAHRRPTDDALVLHIGDRVLIVAPVDAEGRKRVRVEEKRAGMIDGRIYPALGALPPPAPAASSDDEGRRLREKFESWYFAEPAAAPLLLLGWVGMALMCGAMTWRAHVWLTGETAAGKSTLQKLIRAVLGDWGVFTEDASEAAVRQLLGEDTLPVLIDEAEADDRAERQTAMINLARKASSGGKIIRGGADHKAQEFTAQSAFLFSSILHAPLDPQDRNRFAILAMRQVPEGAAEPELDLRMWGEAGRRMHRRMLEQWPRFDRTLADYKREIAALGFQGRWRDTFGTLLACADMLLHHNAPSEDSEANESFGEHVKWVRACLPLMQRGQLEAEDTTTRCIRHLTSSLLTAAPGAHQETVGRWIARAMQFEDNDQAFNKAARLKLKSYGMKVVNLTVTSAGATGSRDADMTEPVYVLVALRGNTALKELFRNSKWYDGGWAQALSLARYEGEGIKRVAESGIKARFTGAPEYAVAVPIEAMIGPIAGAMS